MDRIEELGAGGGTWTLAVQGMDCSSCAESVQKALLAVDGVREVHADVLRERVTIRSEGPLPASALVGAVERAGYHVVPEDEAAPAAADARPAGFEGAPRPWWRNHRPVFAALSGAAWAAALAARLTLGPGAAVTALALTAMAFGGRYIIPRGLRAARHGSLDMNFLMTVAAFGALAIGEYIEAATALFLFSLAQLLESYSMDRARHAIRALMDLSPVEATVIREGKEARIRAVDVRLGDQVVVRPGEKMPIDGEVIEGRSAVNQAPITGESIPVEKEPGSDVFAGSLNGDGVLVVRSTRAPEDTTLARIIHAVEEAQASRAPTQAFVDRFARIYTPVVVIGAVVLAVVPPIMDWGAFADWFHRALVLLVVACPCALVISTPVTIVSALAGAARRGILIKGGLHLENAGRARVVAFDKTGTLTEGNPEVTEVVAFDGYSAREVLFLAGSLEARSAHPLARAVVRHAHAAGVPHEPAVDAAALPGRGVTGKVEGDVVLVGNERLFVELGGIDGDAAARLRKLGGAGRTLVIVGRRPRGNGPPKLLGALVLTDRIRPGAAESLRDLHRAGIDRVVMLTGDTEASARSVAESLGAGGRAIDDWHAELLPQDKVAAVKALQSEYGRVLFVGDGINDAPALATADVGIAMGSAGSDVALETADIALMADDLTRLPTMIRYARKAEGIIRVNIAFALLTKAAFLGLAATGEATLWMAVLADMGSSLIVILNGMRALRA
jgi:Zn2+/Cd2+-exporting ATPase